MGITLGLLYHIVNVRRPSLRWSVIVDNEYNSHGLSCCEWELFARNLPMFCR